MSFAKKSFSDIYANMAADTRRRLPALTDFEEGSVVRSLFESFAYEMATLYEQLDLVYQSGFVDTAEGSQLDRVVAVLGLKRNEPDFAVGLVTFERDKGLNDTLVIPIGTLVTTEEDPTSDPSKKAYLTIEEGQLAPGETAVDVRVQAELRGKQMVTDAETVLVMPRPVPGVKAVTNRKPIRFLGRERETDQELRQRAKQALLASGRASITSLETALLSVPGVRDVQVREDFVHYRITQQALDALKSEQALAPILDLLQHLVGREYRDEDEFTRDVKALTGQDVIPEAILQHTTNSDYLGLGVIEIYVDGLTSQNTLLLREQIDQVRAAGIYVILKPAIAINLEAIVQIDVDVRVATEERLTIEANVAQAISDMIEQLRMGQPLLFTQLTSEVLKVSGVRDVPNFQITAFREAESFAHGTVILSRSARLNEAVTIPARTLVRTAPGQEFLLLTDVQLQEKQTEAQANVQAVIAGRSGELVRTGASSSWESFKVSGVTMSVRNDAPIRIDRTRYQPVDRRINAQILERLVPDNIRVASEQKPLRVRVLLRLLAPKDDQDKQRTTIEKAVNDFFGLLQPGQPLLKTSLETQLNQIKPSIGRFELRLMAFLFQSPTSDDSYLVEVSFIEKPVVDMIFVYSLRLELQGKLALVLSLTATNDEKRAAIGAVRQAINDYLDSLRPEEDVDLTRLQAVATGIPNVLRIVFKPEDCSVLDSEGKPISDKIRDRVVSVDPFEKVYLSESAFIIQA